MFLFENFNGNQKPQFFGKEAIIEHNTGVDTGFVDGGHTAKHRGRAPARVQVCVCVCVCVCVGGGGNDAPKRVQIIYWKL